MKNKKRYLFSCLVLTLCLFLAACGQKNSSSQSGGGTTPSAPVKTTEIAIGSAGAGGAIYPVCAAISDVLSRANAGINATVQATGGNVENLKLVNEKTCDLGISSSFLIYDAINGLNNFKDAKMDNISVLFSNFSIGTMHVVVQGSSSIKDFGGLGGKRIGVGPAGGGNIVGMQDILAAHGVSYDSVRASYVSYEDGINTMMDGNLDAAVAYGQFPIPAISALNASKKDFRILNFTEDFRRQFLAKYTYYVAVDIPEAVYGAPVTAVGTPNIMICSKDLPDDVVYKILQLIYDDENNLKAIYASHPGAANIQLAKATNMLSEYLHPGAKKFYQEKGLL
jgi:TRAP transporter TAXI family solute receptor